MRFPTTTSWSTRPRRIADAPTGLRRVVITGAASGFGLGLAKRFIARGDAVIATDLHDAPNEAVAKLGKNCTHRKLDVTSDEDWERAAAEIGAVDELARRTSPRCADRTS